MKRNILLSSSLYFFRGIQALIILLCFLITGLFIYYLNDPEAFSNVKFTIQEDLMISADGMKFADNESQESKTVFLNDVQPGILYFVYFKVIISVVLAGLVIQEFARVIKSLQQLQTFRLGNVESFRKIAWYFLSIFILNCISILAIKNNVNFTFNFELRFILSAVSALILAEIFKEGNRLYEEEQLTV